MSALPRCKVLFRDHRSLPPSFTPAATTWRTPPSRPRASARGQGGREAAAPAARVGVGGPPGGGRAKIENSSRPHPRKFGLKRFLAVRKVLAGKWGSLFLAYPL